MSRVVLDASALLAVLLGESGADRVAPLLIESAMTSVNLSEVVQHYASRGAPVFEIRQRLTLLPFECVPFGEELAYDAAMLVVSTRRAGLSLGDRACLALARRLGAKALTADRAWPRIANGIGVDVELIR